MVLCTCRLTVYNATNEWRQLLDQGQCRWSPIPAKPTVRLGRRTWTCGTQVCMVAVDFWRGRPLLVPRAWPFIAALEAPAPVRIVMA